MNRVTAPIVEYTPIVVLGVEKEEFAMNASPSPRITFRVRHTPGTAFAHIPPWRRIFSGLFLLGMLLTLAAGLAPSSPSSASLSGPPRGFNRNGRADLVIGVPYESWGAVDAGGMLHVLYGAQTGGISTEASQLWYQNSAGILDSTEETDWFSRSLAIGDFDGDGYLDLAVGVPGETVGSVTQAGAVNVLYGSSSGLSSSRNQFFTQNSIGGSSDTYDKFGYALAAGDFNGDGCDDLAIGVPNEDTGTTIDNGAVNILYGAPSGLMGGDGQMLYQGHAGVIDTPVSTDNFGHSLAAGDFDGDGRDDLAIGIPYKDDGAINNGAAVVVYGSAIGLVGTGSQFWSQNSAAVEGAPENDEYFGGNLSVGDFNGDGHDDLAIGVPGESVNGHPNSGAVNVLYGSSARLRSLGDQIWHGDTLGLPGSAADDDFFGSALSAGDFNGDGKDDLAIGIPGKDVLANRSGAVIILYGGASTGLISGASQFWSQATSGVEGIPEDGDNFGYSLAAGDFNGDGRDDLAVGVPYEAQGTIVAAGAVNVLYGSAGGITASGDRIFSQDSPGMTGSTAETYDRFGFVLAAARWQAPYLHLPLIIR